MICSGFAFAALLATAVIGLDTNDTYRATKDGIDLDSSSSLSIAPNRKLGQSCASSAECEAAFSTCSLGKCACRRGFQKNEGLCKARKTRCPFGKPRGGSISCELRSKRKDCSGPGCTFPPVPARSPSVRSKRQIGAQMMTTVAADPSVQWEDDCPKGSFCLIHNAVFGVNSNSYKGHCCRKPRLNCPLGAPAREYTCHLKPQGTEGNKRFCPSGSHVCLTVELNGLGMPSTADGICCPRPCQEGYVYANNRCYGRAGPAQKCEIDEQCDHSGGVCENGQCVCPKGTINRGTRCEQPTCFVGLGINRKPGSALVDILGNVKECQRESECGEEGYCEASGYCCPKPEPHCPHEPSTPLTNPVFCNPMNRTVNVCPFGEVCLQYYPSSEANRGVCCKRTRVPDDSI